MERHGVAPEGGQAWTHPTKGSTHAASPGAAAWAAASPQVAAFACAAVMHCWTVEPPAAWQAEMEAALVDAQVASAAWSIASVGAWQARRAFPQSWTHVMSRLMHPCDVTRKVSVQSARTDLNAVFPCALHTPDPPGGPPPAGHPFVHWSNAW
jgi:hypothetical protein